MKYFENIVRQMQQLRMPLPVQKTQIRIPLADKTLRDTMSHFAAMNGDTSQWLPEYDQIAGWLSDNQGKGLFLFGSCGRGKSMLCRYALPAILLGNCNKMVSVFDMNDMNSRPDYVLSKHIISLDDVGTEETCNLYGNKREVFAEVMDAAEKRNKLLIVSTNLTVDEIAKRYGERILDRIKATTVRVLFEGKSMRG